jgi:hypothetical protein
VSSRVCNLGPLEAKNLFVSRDETGFSRRANIEYSIAPRSQIYATASFQPSHITHIGNFNAAGQLKERTASVDNSEDSAGEDESKKSKRQKNKNPEYLCRNCGRNDSPEWRKVCSILPMTGTSLILLCVGTIGTKDIV